IVTTRMPGCIDVIRDGWNGFLVPPRDPRLMAERILDLLRDRVAAAAMGARAAQLVRTEFNLENTVARYAVVCENPLMASIRNRDASAFVKAGDLLAGVRGRSVRRRDGGICRRRPSRYGFIHA